MDIDNSQDLLDVRDIIERVETLQELRQPGPVGLGSDEDNEADQDSLFAELADLEALLSELEGSGGNHQWRGSWYPVTLIRDSYWEDSTRELAEDLYGKELGEADWPFNCIDWERAAGELQMDYASVEFDGVTYWYR